MPEFQVAGKLTEMKTIILSIFLPGHSWLLHSLVIVSSPSTLQSFPPFAGGGLVHVRFCVLTPPPQVLEHSPYGFQSEYPPLTMKGEWRTELILYFFNYVKVKEGVFDNIVVCISYSKIHSFKTRYASYKRQANFTYDPQKIAQKLLQTMQY